VNGERHRAPCSFGGAASECILRVVCAGDANVASCWLLQQNARGLITLLLHRELLQTTRTHVRQGGGAMMMASSDAATDYESRCARALATNAAPPSSCARAALRIKSRCIKSRCMMIGRPLRSFLAAELSRRHATPAPPCFRHQR
jgi:hypothetical protein